GQEGPRLYAARVVDLVDQGRGPHPDLVPGGEERLLRPLAVDPAAVPALEVDEHEAVGGAVDAGMEGGHLRVGDGDVVVSVAAEGVAVAGEGERGLDPPGGEDQAAHREPGGVGQVAGRVLVDDLVGVV